jgi:hypothetical protein
VTARDLASEGQLLERLMHVSPRRPAVFLVGTALTCQGKSGVPNVDGVIDLIKSEYPEMREPLADLADRKNTHRYQDAFDRLIHLHGPDAPRRIIRQAVLKARRPQVDGAYQEEDERLDRERDNDLAGWTLTDGATALGAIIAEFPNRFGRFLITTNFDPLLAVSIRRARGRVVQTILHADGYPGQTLVDGCHMIYLHGYWRGHDTLHTPLQILHQRSHLQAFLADLIRRHSIVVMGYGGWDDLFARAVHQVAEDELNAEVDIIWTFYDRDAESKETRAVRERFLSAEARGRASFYYGIDCHDFLPRLLAKLRGDCATAFRKYLGWDRASSDRLEELVMRGCWVNVSTHGPRTVIMLDRPSASGAHVGTMRDLEQLFDHEEKPVIDDAKWEIEGRRIIVESWTKKTHELLQRIEIPTAFAGPIHAGFEVRNLGRSQHEGRSAREDGWHEAWRAFRVEQKLPREMLARDLPETIDQTVSCVAMHVVPWPEIPGLTLPEFSPKGVAQGHWIKFGSFGSTFVVKLDEDGTLTESELFIPDKQWPGRWWLSGEDGKKSLHLWIGHWSLTIHEEIAADETAPVIRDGLLRRGEEIEPVRNRRTSFLVAHVFPIPHKDSTGNLGGSAPSGAPERR